MLFTVTILFTAVVPILDLESAEPVFQLLTAGMTCFYLAKILKDEDFQKAYLSEY